MPTDPTQDTSSGTAPSGRPATRPADGSGADAETVSLAEHQRAIEEERKRRAGQERQHRREMDALKEELESLKGRLGSATQDGGATSPSLTQKEILERLRSPDPSIQRQAMEEGILAMHSWTESLKRTELSARERQRILADVEAAVAEVAEEGVPRDILDLSSPAAVLASAKEWKAQQRIAALEAQITNLAQGRQTVDQAVTRTRAELGASTVSTSTGRPPQLPTELEEQIQAVQASITAAQRLHDGARVTALKRQLRQLQAQAA